MKGKPRIISTFLPPDPEPELLTELGFEPGQSSMLFVFDTLVDNKSVVVGLTLGVVEGANFEDVRVSRIGQAVINRLGAHHRRNYPDAPVVIAGVASVAGAKERVRKVLAQAPEGAAVLLVCADSKVYDAASPCLGIDYQSVKNNPQ